MTKEKNFKRGFVNPLLLAFEWLFVDWWLLRLFSIFYIPTNKHLKKYVKEKVEGDLVSFIKGGKVSSGSAVSYSKDDFELALYYAEVAALKSSPLAYAALSLLMLMGMQLAGIPNEGSPAIAYNVLVFLSIVGVYKYLKVRFSVYKMRRILVDARH